MGVDLTERSPRCSSDRATSDGGDGAMTEPIAADEGRPSSMGRVAPEKPYRLAARRDPLQRTVVRVGEAAIGWGAPVVIAGPCAVEGREQLFAAARAVRGAG